MSNFRKCFFLLARKKVLTNAHGMSKVKKVGQRLDKGWMKFKKNSPVKVGRHLWMVPQVACETGRKGDKNCAQNKLHFIFFNENVLLRLGFELYFL